MGRDSWENRLYEGEPYVSGEQPKDEGLIKLNSNENPYPPAPGVYDAVSNFDATELRLYPPADGGKLREALARMHATELENIFVGNGSDDVLALAFRACFGGEGAVLFPDITYSFYSVWCDLFGITHETVPLTGDFRIAPKDYSRPKRGVVIANPNAPTGIGEGEHFIRAIAEVSGDCVLIVDEAYADFSEFTAASLIRDYPNMLVAKTFSKSRSLAGSRIGYALAGKKLIAALFTVKDSFNSYPLDSLSAAVGVAALGENEYYAKRITELRNTRERTIAELRKMGFTVLPSEANFVMAAPPVGSAEELFTYFRQRKILVRHFAKGRLRDFLRITIGTEAQMDTLLREVKNYVAEKR